MPSKGKEDKGLELQSAIGSKGARFWLGLAPLLSGCFRRRRSLSLLASRTPSEAVNASGSVSLRVVRVLGRLSLTYSTRCSKTCRWVPSECLLHFPNHPLSTALHCTHPESSPSLTRLRLCRLLEVGSAYFLHTLQYHPLLLRATVSRLPVTAINPFDETGGHARVILLQPELAC